MSMKQMTTKKVIATMSRWEFGEYLRALRREKGLSMKKQAEKVGVSAQQLQNLEHGGVVQPKYGTVLKLARTFQIKEKEILNVFLPRESV
jgi:transcriptional regulator with XRE-family HTH domain